MEVRFVICTSNNLLRRCFSDFFRSLLDIWSRDRTKEWVNKWEVTRILKNGARFHFPFGEHAFCDRKSTFSSLWFGRNHARMGSVSWTMEGIFAIEASAIKWFSWFSPLKKKSHILTLLDVLVRFQCVSDLIGRDRDWSTCHLSSILHFT